MLIVLDAKSGYIQMKLDYESSLLTTINTPIGRYRRLKLPFEIKSAPELYQRAMDEILEDTDHAYAIMGVILIVRHDIVHYDSVLEKALHRARTYNLKLNFEKVRVRKQQVRYVGHIISVQGLKPDPEKVSGQIPSNAGRSRNTTAGTNLDGCILTLGQATSSCVSGLNDMCCEAPMLVYYDVRKDVTIHCDASKTVVGAVLLQE